MTIDFIYYRLLFRIIRYFSHIQFKCVPRAHDKHSDALAILASKIDIPDKAVDLRITKKTLREPL